jgi:hypothetical protein
MRLASIAVCAMVLVLTPSALVAQPLDPSIVLPEGGIQFPDGSILTTADRSYDHVIVVAKEGGDFASISEAILSLSIPAVAPSEDNSYLVWVAPGVYEGHRGVGFFSQDFGDVVQQSEADADVRGRSRHRPLR